MCVRPSALCSAHTQQPMWSYALRTRVGCWGGACEGFLGCTGGVPWELSICPWERAPWRSVPRPTEPGSELRPPW